MKAEGASPLVKLQKAPLLLRVGEEILLAERERERGGGLGVDSDAGTKRKIRQNEDEDRHSKRRMTENKGCGGTRRY